MIVFLEMLEKKNFVIFFQLGAKTGLWDKQFMWSLGPEPLRDKLFMPQAGPKSTYYSELNTFLSNYTLAA